MSRAASRAEGKSLIPSRTGSWMASSPFSKPKGSMIQTLRPKALNQSRTSR